MDKRRTHIPEIIGSNPMSGTIKAHSAIISFRNNLAHLVEHLNFNLDVVGSIPTSISFAPCICPRSQAAKTSASHAEDPGSIPGGVTSKKLSRNWRSSHDLPIWYKITQ